MTDVIIEYNGKGVQAFAPAYPGAFARGETKEEAIRKLQNAIAQYRAWTGQGTKGDDAPYRIVYEFRSSAAVEEGATTVLFPSEKLPMDMTEYTQKKALCLRSAKDVQAVFASVPQKDRALVKSRRCFYGRIPQTAREMYRHMNESLSREATFVGITFESGDDLSENRTHFFHAFESSPHFLENEVYTAPDGEQWTRKKLLRRILWHDQIHVRAMYRKAITFWQKDRIANPFRFVTK